MPAATINGQAYNGTVFDAETVRRAPVEAKIIPVPITTVLIGRDGTRNKMTYGLKYRFEYSWSTVPQATRDALWAVRALIGTFPLIHIDGITYTVQIEQENDYDERVEVTMPSGVRHYTIKLVMHQP